MPLLSSSNVRNAAGVERHESPRGADRCDLWLTLRTRGVGAAERVSLTRDEPPVFLHLRATGLLVALPDEDPRLIDDDSFEVTIRIELTDALGLGLVPADFGSGVGLCGGAESGSVAGWRCSDATMIGVDSDGSERPLLSPESLKSWLG